MLLIDTLSSKTICRMLGGAYDVASRSFPNLVRIETTNACNAKCIICPHKDLQRKIRQIDDDLFIRAIDECAENRCPEVHLHNFGEPLLDRSLADRVRYAKSKGIAKVKIFTNGSLLTRQRGRALIDAGLDEIKISFDGATREEFERIRYPLKYNASTQCRSLGEGARQGRIGSQNQGGLLQHNRQGGNDGLVGGNGRRVLVRKDPQLGRRP